MAGIGFELKKLFRRKGLFASLRAYGYAGIICTGPMLLGVLLQLGILLLCSWVGAPRDQQDLLVCMVTYTLLASLTVTSFFSMPVTRFLADMLYEEQEQTILPSFWGSSSMMLVLGCTLYGLFLLVSGATLLQGLLCLWLFAEMIVNWNGMSYLTAIKDYRGILCSFLAAIALAFGLGFVLVVLLFLALSYMTGNMLSTYQNKVLMTVGINIILAVSLNVATGYLGQLPLGHAGFMAVGAYTCALFTKYSPLPDGVSFAIGLALGAVMAGLFGVLIGVPALRLTGDYLAILTLGFGEIIRITLNNIDDVLGFKLFYGSKGLKNIPKYSNFTNVFLCVVITCFLIHAMMKSRHGRAVLAIRDNEIAAESCGIQTTYYKVMAFAFSAAFAGMAGGLYACYIGVLNPSTFGFMKSIEILVMVVLGGMGSMLGSILSATVLTILPEATRSFDSYRMVIYSLVLILMMIFRPGGLLGSYDFSMSRIVEKIMNGELFQKKAKEGADHE